MAQIQTMTLSRETKEGLKMTGRFIIVLLSVIGHEQHCVMLERYQTVILNLYYLFSFIVHSFVDVTKYILKKHSEETVHS